MRYHKIPDETIRRLPIYLRGLLSSLDEGQKSISSQNLADFLGVNPWQIRKDFSYFGDFGTPGVGYDVEKLTKQITRILKLNVVHEVALVGVGNLGSAILAYPGFERYGFKVAAAFDTNPKKIGKELFNTKIEDAANIRTLKERKIDFAIIAVPRDAAQQTADALVKVGVKGILNFSPLYITVPKKVKIVTLDIATILARLPYYVPTSQSVRKGKAQVRIQN